MAEGILSVGDGGRDAGTYDTVTDSPMTLVGEGSPGDALVIQSGFRVRPQTPGGGGSVGDVSREGVTVDNRIARWHGSGAEVQSSVVTINDDGDISGYGTLTGGSSNIQLTDGLGNLILASMEQDGAAALEALVWSGTKWEPGGVMPAGGAIGGTGTIDQIPKFSAEQELADSDMTDDGATTTVVTNDFIVALGDVGIGTTEPESALDVRGPAGSGAASAGVITVSSDEETLVDGDYIGRYDFNAFIPAVVGANSYATQSVTAGANLTDFTLIIDLADMPAEWWALNDSADGTKGRVFKEDLTELASDWISFDNGASTGRLRVKWSGTLSGSAANTIRVHPPLASRSSYASGDTFGSDNAYAIDLITYLSLDEAANTDVDGYADQTQHNNPGTGTGMGEASVPGQVGNAADFDGTDDFITIPDDAAFPRGADERTISFWFNTDTFGGSNDRMFSYAFASGRAFSIRPQDEAIALDFSGHIVRTPASALSAGVSYFCAVVVPSGATETNEVLIYIDGVNQSLSDLSGSPQALNTIADDIGLAARPDGSRHVSCRLDEIQIRDIGWSADEVAEEFAATDDPPGYWGVWSWVPVGGSPTRKVTASIHAEASDTFATDVTSTDIVFSTGTTTSATEKMRLGAIGTLGLGVVPLANMAAGMMVLEGGAIVLAEIATPTADADYAKIYPKADNILYFQDGAGVEHTLPTGTGTEGTIPLWGAGGVALGDSALTQSGSAVTASGNFAVLGPLLSTINTFVGGTVSVTVVNGDNSDSSSSAEVFLQTRVNGGDPFIHWNVLTAQSYVMGIDNSDSDKFVGSVGPSLGTANWLVVTTARGITLDAASGQTVALSVNSVEELQVSDTAVTIPTNNLIVDGGNIGIVAQPNLIVMASNRLTVNGDLSLNSSGGTTDITMEGMEVIRVSSGAVIIGAVTTGATAVTIRASGGDAIRIDADKNVEVPNGDFMVAGGEAHFGGDLWWSGAGSGLDFANISVKDNASITTVNGSGAKVQFAHFDTNGPGNSAIGDQANKRILIVRSGKYKVTCSIAIQNAAGASHVVDISVWLNNGSTELLNVHSHRTLAAGADIGAISLSGTANLTAGDTAEVWLTTNRPVASNVILSDVSLTVDMKGGT